MNNLMIGREENRDTITLQPVPIPDRNYEHIKIMLRSSSTFAKLQFNEATNFLIGD